MIYTCINHPLPGLVQIFCLQRFSSIFESISTCSVVNRYCFINYYSKCSKISNSSCLPKGLRQTVETHIRLLLKNRKRKVFEVLKHFTIFSIHKCKQLLLSQIYTLNWSPGIFSFIGSSIKSYISIN